MNAPSAICSAGLRVAAERGVGGDKQSRKEQIALGAFILVPFLAVLAAMPVAWGGWLGWTDVLITVVMYVVTAARRHGRLPPALHPQVVQAQPPLKIALAIAGSMAIQGPVVRWVADHRKHHKFSDRDGDPHCPWKYGTSLGALPRASWHAHMGWLFDEEQTPQRKYAPDLMKDPRHRPDLAPVPAVGGSISLLAARRRRWPADLVLAGRADRVLLGLAGPRLAAAPRDLVDQLDLPRDRRPAVRLPRQVRQRVVAGDPVGAASPGTTCTTPTRPAPGTA